MVFKEQHARDDDVGTANIGDAVFKSRRVRREFIRCMQHQFKVWNAAAEHGLGCCDGRAEMAVHGQDQDPHGVRITRGAAYMHGRKPPTEPFADTRGGRIAVVSQNKASGRWLKRSALTCGGSLSRCIVTCPCTCGEYMGVASYVSILIDVTCVGHFAGRLAAQRLGCLSCRRSSMSGSNSRT